MQVTVVAGHVGLQSVSFCLPVACNRNLAKQMQHLRTFVLSIVKRYQYLVPDSGLVVLSETQIVKGIEGWVYASRAPDKNIFLVYFEKGSPGSLVCGARVESAYRTRRFDPRGGTWSDLLDGGIMADNTGEIQLPDFPSDIDWDLSLVFQVDRR